jgi:hypothetical protein
MFLLLAYLSRDGGHFFSEFASSELILYLSIFFCVGYMEWA